ncbi:MAG: nitroreductase family protein [Granulosicoccus sp.]
MNLVERTIQARKTSKVLLPVELRHEQQALWTDEHAASLSGMLESAAWAPFHKRAHAQHCDGNLDAPMPWRFHVLDPDSCSKLLVFLKDQAEANPESKWTRAWQSKIKEMVSACGVLIQATWLPDPLVSDEHEPATGIPTFDSKNIEHVAAAASAVQSLLLAAQSCNWLSYWSSGGILKDEDVFDYMGISRQEKLLGSVFLSPEAHPAARILEGGLREHRGELAGWVNRV